MNECQIRGCRNLKTICEDCGRTISTAIFDDSSKWISVCEDLPLEMKGSIYSEEVFVVDRDKTVFICCYCPSRCRWIIDNPCSSGFIYEMETERIRYWMPLPQAPKE